MSSTWANVLAAQINSLVITVEDKSIYKIYLHILHSLYEQKIQYNLIINCNARLRTSVIGGSIAIVGVAKATISIAVIEVAAITVHIKQKQYIFHRIMS